VLDILARCPVHPSFSCNNYLHAKDIEMVKGFATKLLSLTFIVAGLVAAQSVPPRKDIPAIAKAANGAIVTIVTANDDKPIAQGTGFIVNPEGVIVTNYHVIKTGNVAGVKFSDGAVFAVDGVLAADKDRDLAVIKIHGRTFQTLVLGNSDKIQVGEEVVAIGNPLGLELTVSNGILSGIRTDKAGGTFLQITAPFTHGSSGGPLFNMAGEVVGITTLVYEGAGNLNFAIPVNDAKRLLSNQSAKLQNLPNEPESKETEPKVTHDAQPTLSQQKMCSEQATKNFNDSSFSDDKSSLGNTYTSHYDAAASVCYMEVTTRHMLLGNDFQYYNLISDAFENRVYGQFMSFSKGVKVQECSIKPLGQTEITCKSSDEFNELALKYFGTVPD